MNSDVPDDGRTVIRSPEKTQIVAPPEDVGRRLPVDTMLAGFRRTELIGVGGFAVVYEAFDAALERKVALKAYMPSSLAPRVGGGTRVQVNGERCRDPFEAGRQRFVGEARLRASVGPPSLVAVCRFWEANGAACIVMPLIEGDTLKDVLREMHRKGEPVEGGWLLLDFGAARRAVGAQTQALGVILEPGCAPSQACGGMRRTTAPAPAPVVAPSSFDPVAGSGHVGPAQSAGDGVRRPANETRYRIDRDHLAMTVQAEREAYPCRFVRGAGGTPPMQRYPGPADLRVRVSPRQRDRSALQPEKDGTIRVLPTGAARVRVEVPS